jgi:uncharacterized cupin superfamily protein
VIAVIEETVPFRRLISPHTHQNDVWVYVLSGEVEVLTPAGTERWFEEIAALAAGDRAGFEDACGRHGIHFLSDSPRTPELKRRFGLL